MISDRKSRGKAQWYLLFAMLGFTACSNLLWAQMAKTSIPEKGITLNFWKASWISMGDAAPKAYGVYHFRRSFQLDTIPEKFIVHVSADNRYRLFVNGRPVGFGPARGDLLNWRYETYDLAPLLVKGKNVLAAQVVNFGEYAPVAQISGQTGFILQQGEYGESMLYTGDGKWKVSQNMAYSPIKYTNQVKGYYAAGPGDRIDYSQWISNWQEIDFDDSSWESAATVGVGKAQGSRNNAEWYLIPRTIPMMEQKVERFPLVRRVTGTTQLPPFATDNPTPWKIPANSTVTILIDNQVETVGFPVLQMSKGAGSQIKLTYSESLYHDDRTKGNRNDIEGKKILGYSDILLPNGTENQTFTPLWWRTFRYLQIEISTKEQGLVINDLYNNFTAYPFKLKARFETENSRYAKIWEMSWRTSRLCAFETYMDCPYYEQLNYIGDTRIQALVSLYLSGDDRLMKDAIRQFESSRNYLGITQGRYPSNSFLIIPPYSLFLIGMEHDYLMYRNDPDFIRPLLPGIEQTLNFYLKYLNGAYLLENLDWWQFTDWSVKFPAGVPPGSENGQSANLSLQYLYAIQQAVELFAYFGLTREADHWSQIGDEIKKAVYSQCYANGLIAETPEKTEFSQHANILAILTNTIPPEQQQATMKLILEEKKLHQTTLYFKFYLFKALKKVGMGNLFPAQLSTWYTMVDQGYSTCGETGEPHHDRSDCHAWSASPALFFLNLVCGIESVSPGFSKIQISPSPGMEKRLTATMPHPQGEITIDLTVETDHMTGTISLPPNTNGSFNYMKQNLPLKAGENLIKHSNSTLQITNLSDE